MAGDRRAQEWPTRPITMVVPFPAGGPIDFIGRLMAQKLSESLGQQVIIENIGGAGGMNGAARVAKSTPDGSMFLFGNQGTHTFSQLLYKKPLYNAVADFAPVGVLVENVKFLATRKDFPAKQPYRIHRLCQGEPEDHAVRLGRHWLGDARYLCAAQSRDRRRHRPRALSRHRAGPAGHDCRPHRLHVRGDLDRRAACARRRYQGAGDPVADAQRRAAGRSDRARAGAQGFRRRRLERVFLPARHARRRSCASSRRRRARSSTCPTCASGWRRPASMSRRRSGARPDYLGKLVVSELEKWGPPVRASGVSAD